MPGDIIEVAASIVRMPDGRVLMAERTAGQISPGFWELPGGKIDSGESAEHAAIRELDEEIGIRALSVRRWISYVHAFPLRRIRLHFFKVERWEGTPHGREGQRLAWIDPAMPSVAPILPSVERVLAALGLPALYAVCRTADHADFKDLLEHVAAGARRGLRLFQLRVSNCSPDQRVALARRLNTIAASAGAHVLLVGSALEARRAGLAGVHSTAEELRRLSSRPPVALWLCSCHDEADLARAIELGADGAVVSPVSRSAAHPERAALGWEGLKRWCARATLPLYAQGGLEVAHLDAARSAGAIGIATTRWHVGSGAREREAAPAVRVTRPSRAAGNRPTR
jgi:8-oxo-dGTP diphosphatase